MALQTAGTISMNDIAIEMGFASGTITELRLQKPGSVKQVWIQGAWRNLNMCSPFLPTHTAPFDVDHWYGYSHTATSGVTSVGITGTTSVVINTAYNYTAVVNGLNQSGITYTWSITGGAGTINSGGTSSVANITWTNLTGAQLTLTIGNTCQGSNVANSITINAACTSPTSAVISGNTNVQWTGTYTYTLTSSNGTDSGKTYTWIVGSFATIVSGQGTTSIQVAFAFNSPYSNQSTTVKVNVNNGCTNGSGNVDSNIITVTPNYVYNALEVRTYYKQCSGTGVGSAVNYTLNANTYKDYNSTDLQTQINNYFDTGGQSNANTNGSCTWTGVNYCQYYVKNDGCAAHYLPNGSNFCADWQAGGLSNYQSTSSQAAADALAVAWVQSNGQAWVNANMGCYQYEFGNVAKSASAFKNNCSSQFGSNYCNTGTQRTYTIAANTIWRSTQIDADNQAQQDANNGVQAWVNSNYGLDNCYQCVFQNDTAKTACANTSNCGGGYTGCQVCLTTGVGTISSNISVAQANIDAQNYVNNNVQAYANTNQCCTPSCNITSSSIYSDGVARYQFRGNTGQTDIDNELICKISLTDNSTNAFNIFSDGYTSWLGDGVRCPAGSTINVSSSGCLIGFNAGSVSSNSLSSGTLAGEASWYSVHIKMTGNSGTVNFSVSCPGGASTSGSIYVQKKLYKILLNCSGGASILVDLNISTGQRVVYGGQNYYYAGAQTGDITGLITSGLTVPGTFGC